MKFLRSIFLFSLVIVIAASAFANALPQGDTGNEFRWHGRIGEGKTVEIKGVNGEVRAEVASGEEVEVVAVKRSSWGQGNAQEVQIKLIEHADGITVCALYPQRDGRLAECKPGAGGQNSHKNNVNVAFTVRVPRDVHFIGRTVNGSVTARSLGGNVQATTVNGGIEVSTKGYAKASTVNGSITVACGRANWDDELEFQTVNGSIDVTLPENTRSEIEASTVNGRISTDLPLILKGKLDKRHLRGMLGNDSEARRQLRLNTVNGSISVKGGRGTSTS